MSCCAAGTNGCLDLRRRAFALGGRVSAEWSRCPGSMARRARDSVTPLRRSEAGWMPARIGRLSAGIGRKHPWGVVTCFFCRFRWYGWSCDYHLHDHADHVSIRQQLQQIAGEAKQCRWLLWGRQTQPRPSF